MSGYAMTSGHGPRMLASLPRYYETSRVIGAIMDTEGQELDLLSEALTETLDQFYARTAEWGLPLWEKEYNLSVAPGQPVKERQDQLVSRIRGTGTATLRIVKEVAEAYDNGSIDVLEHHAAYTVTIRFVDTTGVPPNLDDLKAAVRAVLPAHLAVEYSYNYFVWDDLDGQQWTWDQLDALQLTWDQLEVYG